MRGSDDVLLRQDGPRAVDALLPRRVDVGRPRSVDVDHAAVDDPVDIRRGGDVGGVCGEEAALGVVLEGQGQGHAGGGKEL